MNTAILIVMDIVVSVAILFFVCGHNSGKRSWAIILFVAFGSIGLAFLFRKLYLFRFWSDYECFLINSMITCFFSLPIKRFLLKEKIGHIEILKVLCVIAISCAIYSTLTKGQAEINSDTATATLLAKSQVAHHSLFPASWNYANGEIWTISNSTFSAPFVFLMKNQTFARSLGSAMTVLFTVWAVSYHSRHFFNDYSWVISVPVFLVFFAQGNSPMIIHQAAYTLMMAWLVLIPFLTFSVVVQKRKGYFIILVLCLIIFTIGGTRFIAEIVLPLWLTFMYFCYIERKKNKGEFDTIKAIMISCILLLPTLAGFGVYLWLCGWHNMNHTVSNMMIFSESIGACWENFKTCMFNLFANFGYKGGAGIRSLAGIGNAVTLTICGLLCFIVPTLQGIKIKNEKKEIKFFYTFGILHNAIIFVAASIFRLIDDRYVLSVVFVSIIISARYIYVYWLKKKSFGQIVMTTLLYATTVIECVILLAGSSGWLETVNQKKEFNRILSEKGLDKGYASYWNAYGNEIYSDLNIRYGAIVINEEKISPYLWLVDSDVYIADSASSFLLLGGDGENKQYAKAKKILGEADEIINDDYYHIYIYDYDIAQRFVR